MAVFVFIVAVPVLTVSTSAQGNEPVVVLTLRNNESSQDQHAHLGEPSLLLLEAWELCSACCSLDLALF